jgi:prolyl-tRNA editing enzyme YbaK/EbsC (Cys-tRNA(Pro) deacylase)
MSIEKVRAYFAANGMDTSRILEFPVSSATVEQAAQAAGVRPARIAKTLSFMTPEGPVLVVAAGDARIDNSAYKAFFHCKARMLERSEAEAIIGHAPGGICPFAVNPGVKVYLDQSLKRFNTVFPACGSSNSAIELDCDTLFALSKAIQWVDVCRDWQQAQED